MASVIRTDLNWVKPIVEIIESSINKLLDDFMNYPFRHRKEHSLHCELYHILMTKIKKQDRIIDYNSFVAGIVQKEWPETIPSPGTKRGNFDISIIGPPEDSNKVVDVSDFEDGRLRPAVVIEFGLNYGLSHLRQDKKKLKQSAVEYGYIVHFDRNRHYKKTIESIEREINKIIANENSKGPNIAYACIDYEINKWRFRKLNESEINFRDIK